MGSHGNLVVAVFSLETIPLGILVWSTRDRSLRRPQFWVRFALLVFCVTLPELVLVALSGLGLVGQAGLGLLWGGFVWGVLLVQLGPHVLLVKSSDSSPPSDDGPDGPDPRDGRPSPHPPIGGVPLPDAEQSSIRIRGAHPRRHAVQRRRSARPPKRAPSRM